MEENIEKIIEYDPYLRTINPIRGALKIGGVCCLAALLSAGSAESEFNSLTGQLSFTGLSFGVGAIIGNYWTKFHNAMYEPEYQRYSKIVYNNKDPEE